MNSISNQDIERYYFERFCKDYPLPAGTITYGDCPDIRIEGEKLIGIEMTNFFLKKGSLLESEQIQIKLRERAIAEAQHIYLEGKGRKIEISFGFNETSPIQDHKKLARKLTDLASQIEHCETGRIRQDFFGKIPELSMVYLNTQEYEDAKWRVFQVYDVPLMSRDRLIDIVRDKERRSEKYTKCDVYWLLVVVDSINPAQDQMIKVDNFKPIQSKVFERIIVYKTFAGDVLEAKMLK